MRQDGSRNRFVYPAASVILPISADPGRSGGGVGNSCYRRRDNRTCASDALVGFFAHFGTSAYEISAKQSQIELPADCSARSWPELGCLTFFQVRSRILQKLFYETSLYDNRPLCFLVHHRMRHQTTTGYSRSGRPYKEMGKKTEPVLAVFQSLRLPAIRTL